MIAIPASRKAWTMADPYLGPRPGPNERIISVTSLLNAPRIVRLLALHRAELPPDTAGEDTWRLLGTAVHKSLSDAAVALKTRLAIREIDDPSFKAPILIEHRAETSITVDGIPWVLSGQNDVLEADGTLWDYKVTSSWSVSDGRRGKSAWDAQLNVLRWLLERSGTVPRGTVKGLAVWAILRDWSATQAGRDTGYPQSQEIAVPFALWSEEETFGYVVERLRLHEAARHQLPECSPEDRWAKDAGFAVMKSVKAARAERFFTAKEDAERYQAEILNGKGFIEERHGTSKRCLSFCPVRSVCSFAQSLK